MFLIINLPLKSLMHNHTGNILNVTTTQQKQLPKILLYIVLKSEGKPRRTYLSHGYNMKKT